MLGFDGVSRVGGFRVRRRRLDHRRRRPVEEEGHLAATIDEELAETLQECLPGRVVLLLHLRPNTQSGVGVVDLDVQLKKTTFL